MKTTPTLVWIVLGLLSLTACSLGTALSAEADPTVESAAPMITAQPEIASPADKNNESDLAADAAVDAPTRPAGWTAESHSKSADPNYEVVFPQNEVNRIDITISPENWAAMQANMTELYGEFGAQPNAGQPPGGPPNFNGEGEQAQGQRPPRPPLDAPAEGFDGPPAGGMMAKEGDEYNPIWVPATVEFAGQTWQTVGIRFKGNSSLNSSWRSGNLKLPFKLDFDEFEDDFPEIDDQRFYGFKQLTLSSNFHDPSFLREKITADIFREAGVPAAHTAFYQVYLDYGEGPEYFGLYTLVEVIDDTVIETQFSSDDGNLYKPTGRGASFAAGTFNTESFDKETNAAAADWGDVEALYTVLHAETRQTNPEQWRQNLETVFDVDVFLKWLAANTIVQNWDTYGLMTHNYYLYDNPDTGQLTWIPWDNNEALKSQNRRNPLSLRLDEVSAEWPLIRFLLDDPVYAAQYQVALADVIAGPFNPNTLVEQYQRLHDLVRPYVVGENGEVAGYTHLKTETEFENALTELIQHTRARYNAVTTYLEPIQ